MTKDASPTVKRFSMDAPNITDSRLRHEFPAAAVLDRIRLSAIYLALTGKPVKPTGGGRWRARALWRGGKQLSVAGDDRRGVWMDHVSGEAGGVLDLVVRVRGGTRQDALRWAAEFSGVPLENKPQSERERAEWIREQRRVERLLPTACCWRSAMIALTDELLDHLKAKLMEPVIRDLDFGEIYRVEQFLARLRRIDGVELIREFQSWMTTSPVFSEALTRCGREREATQLRALEKYIAGK
jgi:hypothetical protein